jgi:hypothetical protein
MYNSIPNLNTGTLVFSNVDTPCTECATRDGVDAQILPSLWDGDLFEEDQEGTDLPDLATARDEALKFAQEFSGDLKAPDQALVAVADEQGSTLWTIQLSRMGGTIRSISH